MTARHTTAANLVILSTGIGLLCLAAGCAVGPYGTSCLGVSPLREHRAARRVIPCDPMFGYRPTCWQAWQDDCMAQRTGEMPLESEPDLPGLPGPSDAVPGERMPIPGKPAGEVIPLPPGQPSKDKPHSEPASDRGDDSSGRGAREPERLSAAPRSGSSPPGPGLMAASSRSGEHIAPAAQSSAAVPSLSRLREAGGGVPGGREGIGTGAEPISEDRGKPLPKEVVPAAWFADWIPFNTFKPSRLVALTARQNLHDDVCIAMADGQIDPAERFTILSHAKEVLAKQEYEGLKRTMNRLSPPQKAADTPHIAVAQSGTIGKPTSAYAGGTPP